MSTQKPLSRNARIVLALHMLLGLTTLWHLFVTTTGYYGNLFYLHDVGTLDYRLYFTWHGRVLWDVSHNALALTKHFQPSMLLLVPFHALFRHMLFLPLLETLAVCSTAWGVAWMVLGASRLCGDEAGQPLLPATGLALGWLCLAHPLSGSVILANHYDSLTLAGMVWALAALLNGHVRWFWVLVVFSLGFKEDGGLYWMGFGVWWLFFGWEHPGLWRCRLRRATTLVALGALWSLAGMALIQWASARHGTPQFFYANRMAWLGDSPGEVVLTLLKHPVILLGTPVRVGWIVLWPLLLLPLAAPSTLILLLPGAYLMGLLSGPQRDLMYYYSYPLLPFAFLGAALGLGRLIKHWPRARATLVVACLVAGAFFMTLPTRTDGRRRLPAAVTQRHHMMRGALREFLPRDASVAAQFDLFCQVPYRTNIYPLTPETMDGVEYWALDLRGFPGDMAGPPYRQILERAKQAVASGRAKVTLQSDGFLLIHNEKVEGAIKTR